MPRRRLLLHHHQTAYEPETLELPDALYARLRQTEEILRSIHVE